MRVKVRRNGVNLAIVENFFQDFIYFFEINLLLISFPEI